jgi:hypothetical protein
MMTRRQAKRQFYRKWLKANGVKVPANFAKQSDRLLWHHMNRLTLLEDITKMMAEQNAASASEEKKPE